MEANISSASQEIPHIIWNPKVHYCVQQKPPFVPIVSHTNPTHAISSYFFNIHFNIVL